MQVIDNFLPPEIFEGLSKYIMSSDMPWYFIPSVAKVSDKPALDNYFHSHLAYENHVPISNVIEVVAPLLKNLGMKSLIRVILNMYPYTPKLKIHEDHVDFDYSHKGAILYLNTCDGYTYCEGEKVSSVANRVLLHDPSKLHHSTTTSDAHRRVICNVNYF